MAIHTQILIYEHEKAVLYRDGRLIGPLAPGRHAYWFGTWEAKKIDGRAKVEVIGNQEVPTKDEIPVRISLFFYYRVEDPVLWFTAAESSQVRLHAAAQIALRDALAQRTFEELSENRSLIATEVSAKLAEVAPRLGVVPESVEIRDLTYPSNVRDAMVAVVRARKEAQASLEKARGEHAALRSLLNAARLLDDHPQLLALRTLQVAESTRGTLVVGNVGPVIPRKNESP